jgi:hypothetical protein
LAPYFLENPGTTPVRCSHVRRAKSSVIPMYKVPFRRLAKIYTKKLTRDSWVPASAGTSGLDLTAKFPRSSFIGNDRSGES